MKYIASILFACAVIHTFCVKFLAEFAHRYPEGSIGENLFHFLSEIEVVFGLWAAMFILVWTFRFGTESAANYMQGINYTEPTFVFVIMCMAATKPVLAFAKVMISSLARLVPVQNNIAQYCSCLIIGPLLGSLITEPAAMTVTAILLRDKFFDSTLSLQFRYASLGLLFVNISIGGTLTHFGAPPIIMVAQPWKWDTLFMLTNFGWRAAIAISLGTILTAMVFRKDIVSIAADNQKNQGLSQSMPKWVIGVHLAFLVSTILTSHYLAFFVGIFLFFLGWCAVTKEYQDEIRLRESLLVGFFLAGLVTLGKLQEWWLAPALAGMGDMTLYWGGLSLTAITDNAAITYLGTLVPNLSDAAKFALVAGGVSGGGLTVIANAPNPAGYGLLKDKFGDAGISPLGLFLGALPYTGLAAAAFLF
ncbi:MAG: putative Na+/H+ antiporter [Proteobacteria bacterium]|nr:putative Na+/H+ antiporter [Pseudomonadota bacterium]